MNFLVNIIYKRIQQFRSPYWLLSCFFLSFSLVLQAAVPASPSASVSKQEIVHIGDRVQVVLKEDASFDFEGLVSESGTIDIPYLGEQAVAGKGIESIERALGNLLEEEHYWKATVELRILSHAPASVYVFGAVKEPGLIELPPSGELSVTQLLAAVKGLTSWADIDQAYIIRRLEDGREERMPANIREQLLDPAKSTGLQLRSGDELFVPRQSGAGEGILLSSEPLEVIVVGQVNAPGVIKFAPGEVATLMRAVFKAGGLTRFAKGTELKLIRYAGNERTVEIVDLEVVIEKGFLDQDRQLLPGDMVIVPQKFINL